MKNVTLFALVLVAICLLAATLAWCQGGNVEEQVKTLQAQFTQAFLRSDTAFLEKYFADDYTAIHGDGKLSTKAEEIDEFKSGAIKYDSINVREAKIRTYGDTAVVNSLFSVKGMINGKPFSGDVRNIRVWVKHKGDWKIVAFQNTRVAPSQ